MPAVFKRQYLRFARTRVQVKVWDSAQDFSVEILEIWKVQNREGEEDMKNQKQVAMPKPYWTNGEEKSTVVGRGKYTNLFFLVMKQAKILWD